MRSVAKTRLQVGKATCEFSLLPLPKTHPEWRIAFGEGLFAQLSDGGCGASVPVRTSA
jgi:hypothetical protein